MVNYRVIIYNILIDLDSRFVTKSAMDDFPIYGSGGFLDSLDLVRLIISIEQKLSIDENRAISLSSSRAMSHKNNPYRTFNSLVEFVEECLQS
jgi:acyl carrier protein